ncbi:MAG TPA: ribosomal protein S18-alanine N-acetyltransferase [Burkholderiaceae bacterium]
MSAMPTPAVAGFEPMTESRLDAVLRIEQRCYDHPWSHTNFTDSLRSGYEAQLLVAGDGILGYFVAMQGVDEVHLLNITVAPEHQRQGWARVMLDGLAIWSRNRGAQWLWLEVRASNLRAYGIYERYGFRHLGERKNYYPAAGGQREHALVMSLKL